MRTTKKTSKKNLAGKIFFISRNELVFFEMFFYLPKFFPKIGNNLNARAGQKKTHVLVMRGLNQMRTLI